MCALLPSLSTRTRILLVMSAREEAQISNTGRLAHFALPESRLVVRGLPYTPVDLSALDDPERRGLVLYPEPGVAPLSEADRGVGQEGGPGVCLVVPDGGWSQAKRIVRSEARIGALPWRGLANAPPGRYHLRTAPQPGHLSTFEAIAEALAILEDDGPAIRDALMTFFDEWVGRNLAGRGGRRSTSE